MKLYHSLASPYCQKVLMALYEKGVPFEQELPDLADPEARATFERTVYPLGRLPLLVLDDGWRIPESSIILEYLDTHFPGAHPLIPVSRDLARQARYWDRLGDLYISDAVTLLAADPRRPESARRPDDCARARQRLAIVLGWLDARLSRQEHVLGSELTLADLAPFVGIAAGRRAGSINLGERAALGAWFARMASRPSAQRLYAELDAQPLRRVAWPEA